MVRPLHAGVRLTAIFDSCHSGTALDLPYIYSTQGILKEPNLAKEAGQGLLGVISAYDQGDLGGVASNIMSFFKKATGGEDNHARSMATKTSPADVIMFSGSKMIKLRECIAFLVARTVSFPRCCVRSARSLLPRNPTAGERQGPTESPLLTLLP